jgi:RNA polymerase sigma factor (sigma-70 family)
MSDELLVVRAQLGERAALAELVRCWSGPVRTYVRQMLDAGRADDVAQEVWLAVLRGLPRLRDTTRFKPWLFTIVRRTVTDHLRAEYARAAAVPWPEKEVTDDPGDAIAERAELVAALGALPVLEREILVLFYLEDLSVQDCAQICRIPAGTVKSRLNRARRLLGDHLTEKGYRP